MQSHELARLRFQVEQQLSLRLQMVEFMLQSNVEQDDQSTDTQKSQLKQIEEYIQLVKREIRNATKCCNGAWRLSAMAPVSCFCLPMACPGLSLPRLLPALVFACVGFHFALWRTWSPFSPPSRLLPL